MQITQNILQPILGYGKNDQIVVSMAFSKASVFFGFISEFSFIYFLLITFNFGNIFLKIRISELKHGNNYA